MKMKPIEFTGGNDLLIWKVPSKVVSFNREIIVPFTHEVVFVKNGIIMETLDSGKHVLNPKEFSFLGKIIVNGPGQKASAKAHALSLTPSATSYTPSISATWTIKGLSDGLPFAE